MTGPNPVDRGRTGSKIHILSDRAGVPLSVAVSAANTHDAAVFTPLVMAIPAVRSRRGSTPPHTGQATCGQGQLPKARQSCHVRHGL